MNRNQKTLKKRIEFSGVGIHTGKHSKITLFPSGPNTGIFFERIDLKNKVKDISVKASYKNVKSTYYCTELSNKFGTSILTVEHLLAALFGTGVTNAKIQVDGPEIPILDGCSETFVAAIINAGCKSQKVTNKLIKIKNPITYHNDSSWAEFSPHKKLFIESKINFRHTLIGKQEMAIEMNESSFQDEISSARTFGFLEHAEKLNSMGYGLGVNLSNTIVLSEKQMLNQDGLNYNDEFVRHKILDICGDLMLAGYGIIGKFTSNCGGHCLNHRALMELFNNEESWELIDASELYPDNIQDIEQDSQPKLVNL